MHQLIPDLMEKQDHNSEEIQGFKDHLAKKYGSKDPRDLQNFHSEFKVYKICRMLKDIRNQQQLTQQELADRIGTQKSAISRIENGADMNLSTLIKICDYGLQKPLHFVFGEILQ
ncbi:MAG: helix-turn-helix domain-containing protein [Bacteroidia bacterium]|nr:helix-turn-helix domain-containing protein [Bacteroidia bacterium]